MAFIWQNFWLFKKGQKILLVVQQFFQNHLLGTFIRLVIPNKTLFKALHRIRLYVYRLLFKPLHQFLDNLHLRIEYPLKPGDQISTGLQMWCRYLASLNRIYFLIPIIHFFDKSYAFEFLNYWLEAIVKIGQTDVLLAGVKCSLEFLRFYYKIVFKAFSQEFIHHVYFHFVSLLGERVHHWHEGGPFDGNYVS